MLKNKKVITLVLFVVSSLSLFITNVFAIVEVDNGNMKIYTTSGGLEFGELKGFDIQGYIEDEATNEKKLISSTFSDDGYHTFLNVNGANGEMQGQISYTDEETLDAKLKAMQYTAYEQNNEWQNINGIDLKVNTQFINEGEQLQIIYNLKNTTSQAATFSLATTADVQIDGDDSATIERLEDGSGVRLWTKEGELDKPVQFVFYGKGVNGTTAVDNLWIGRWGSEYMCNMFNNNPEDGKVENADSAFAFSWTNRTIAAGETKVYTVLMEVGEINVPNTGITLDNNKKFYYADVVINGTVTDKDLKDKITIFYEVDGTQYELPPISTEGTAKEFSIDLTSLNLSAVEEHTIKVWAKDSTECDSNTEERTFTITYLKNHELSVSNEEWTNDDVTFKITDTENADFVKNYQYRINNGEWINCEKDIDIPVSGTGTVQIDTRIEGTKINDYSDIITKYVKIDKTNPTNTIPTATKTTCSISVHAAQTDADSGIDDTKTMYAIKIGDSWSEWQSSNVFTGLTHNTDYIVKTKSTDNAGNTLESEELTVKTDELLLGNLILKLNSSEGANYNKNTWTNQSIYVAIEERSVGATTTYKSKENSAQNITATNQETTVIQDGNTILVLEVTDGTNTITSNEAHILKIDKTAPVINELYLDNEEWSTESKNITGKAIDSLSGISDYQFANIDDITASSQGWNNITATTDEITQTKEITESGKVYFYVKDVAGNIASVSIDSKIDSIGPVITFAKANGKTTINVTDTGAGVNKVQYAWSTENEKPADENLADYSEPIIYAGTSKDKIYLWAKAVDNTGNETISSTEFNSIINPQIVSDNEFVNEYIKFKLNSDNKDEDVSYQFKIDDGQWQNITKDNTYTITNITEGQVVISARVLDNSGRYSEVVEKTVKVSIVETPSQEYNKQDNEEDNNDDGNNAGDKKQPEKTNSSDNTTSKEILPDTGVGKVIMIFIVILGISVIFAYKKIKFYKDIK